MTWHFLWYGRGGRDGWEDLARLIRGVQDLGKARVRVGGAGQAEHLPRRAQPRTPGMFGAPGRRGASSLPVAAGVTAVANQGGQVADPGGHAAARSRRIRSA